MTIITGLPLLATAAQASTFFDDFNSGPSPLWKDQRGSWFGNSGTYDAQFPSNAPTTYSVLSYALGDFSVDVDVNNLQDCGIWLRSSFSGGSESVVLLVTGGDSTGLYWPTVQSGSYSGTLNPATTLTTSLSPTGHVASTTSQTRPSTTFNLQAVPEPATVAALGLGVVLGLRRKRKA